MRIPTNLTDWWGIPVPTWLYNLIIRKLEPGLFWLLFDEEVLDEISVP